MHDLFLQSLSVLLQYPEYMKVFEMLDNFTKEKFINSLLNGFDSRFWIPVSNILLRFWRVMKTD